LKKISLPGLMPEHQSRSNNSKEFDFGGNLEHNFPNE